MTDSQHNPTYAKRFEAVLAYIDSHLEGDLSVNALSRIANFSAFHFHRQFTAYMGIPVSRYVQLMRLRRAAHQLVASPAMPVLEAAFGAGFESPEAFSRAFKRAFGMAPSVFAKAPNWQAWSAVFVVPHLSRSITMQIRIVDFAETRVAALEHRGPPGLVGESVARFRQWRMHSGQSPVASSRTFGIPYDNPDTTPPDAFRFAVCGEIDEAVQPNDFAVHERVIPAGRCAVIRHIGSPDYIGETIYPLYRDWLPSSNEELRDHPLFFQYLSVYPETPLEQWQTDIYVPLK
ncbi:TPA: GyrI-like domain-containing protein [Pseudomonas putida]|uniref:Transcriptional regulator, AraC family n=1 Tax=Pseudomonas putida (strain GB-1) TaxID=76869 RepID=B0KIA1_PSEPG|nr:MULTISPECIES: AraC family transcriptional regulator [Pseudomonas]ABY97677.1 transcriptional regulator, AraC family [Pseudomonas putida GB-1]APE98064.1 AraC family transcriptional regulator [Pseudomonas putida]MBP0710767.1 AraC family transcriptional regulator [Pseudomonas sp. T34]MCE1003718.1 AraC family transcriptional regulator [Pseudomonas sp. NMI1173_11]MCK2190214.1 AraC family transcriptional regulator [Pseudomonas sp. MB04B]